MSLLFLKFLIYLNCTILLFANLDSFIFSDEFVVEIENGKIIGESYDDFYAYKGIPYAAAERFSEAKPFEEKWSFVRAFKKFGDVCAQYDQFAGYSFHGVEDCLTLNVFVPKEVTNSKKEVPVIFFIHGGAFMFGGSNVYGPEIIMKEQEVILVTINYRLGILGFLSTEDEVLPGNLGLKDQVEALKWVQRNIKAFNGDPKKVTTVGFSAGGASVHLHYMSKLSKGLFNNGISHSGVATNPWVMMERGREKAHEVGALLQCDFKDDHENLVKCLKNVPLEKLVMAEKNFQPFLYNPFSPFGVSIEPKSERAFLTEHPKEILKNGNMSKLPWIASLVEDEGLYPSAEFYDEKILKSFDENWQNLAPHLLDFNGTSSDIKIKERFSNLIREFYFGNETISKENFDTLRDLFSDRLYKAGFNDALSQNSLPSKYCYYFKYHPKESKSIITSSQKNLGIAHGDDVFLIFDNRDLSDYSDGEKSLGKCFVEMYRKFAADNEVKFGDKNITKIDNNLSCMEIVSPSSYKMTTMEESFGNSEFWKSLKIQE